MNAIVYSTLKCTYCTKAYNLLKGYNIKVEKKVIEADFSGLPTQTEFNTHMYESVQKKADDNQWELMKIMKDNGVILRSVPQVIIDNKLIGGYDATEEWCKDNIG